MAGLAIITEACIDVKDRACVDACPVQCIYEFDPAKNVLFSEDEAGSGVIETTHAPNADAIAIFADSLLYVNLDECTSCTACYQPDVCPVGAIYAEEHLPDGTPNGPKYNANDPNTGHDHTFFLGHSRAVFAD
jgi:Fe-S-cluster-containing hydrogenase component 2